MGKFIPYDPDSIDERIDATYRDDIQYLDKKIKRIHLYQINGYKLNDTLFLTSDYAKGKIDAQVIDEMVRKMILPRVKGIVK